LLALLAWLVIIHTALISIFLQCAHFQPIVFILALFLLGEVLSVVLVGDALTVLGEAHDRQLNRQSFLHFVEFRTTLLRIALVLQIQVKIVKTIDTENKCAFIDIELSTLHVFAMLGKDGHSERLWQL